MKHHLAVTDGKIGPCAQVTNDVEDFFIHYLEEKEQQKYYMDITSMG